MSYPPIEPYDAGHLDSGDGNLLYWEACGNPDGVPALVLHGGPGSGCNSGMRRFFDPERYSIVLFDQRQSGRSEPHASDPTTSLELNTTWHLVADIERLRLHLGAPQWTIWGGSWGSTLGLVYAISHPEHVSGMVLCGVGLGRKTELDWLFRGGLSKLFPAQWSALTSSVSNSADPLPSLAEMLESPDHEVRETAAMAWALWESATPNWPPTQGLLGRFQDPEFAYAFSRIVIHYVRNDLWLEDNFVLRNVDRLTGIQGVLINGRFDFQSPIENAWLLSRAWQGSRLEIVDGAGHGFHPEFEVAIRRATDELSR